MFRVLVIDGLKIYTKNLRSFVSSCVWKVFSEKVEQCCFDSLYKYLKPTARRIRSMRFELG